MWCSDVSGDWNFLRHNRELSIKCEALTSNFLALTASQGSCNTFLLCLFHLALYSISDNTRRHTVTNWDKFIQNWLPCDKTSSGVTTISMNNALFRHGRKLKRWLKVQHTVLKHRSLFQILPFYDYDSNCYQISMLLPRTLPDRDTQDHGVPEIGLLCQARVLMYFCPHFPGKQGALKSNQSSGEGSASHHKLLIPSSAWGLPPTARLSHPHLDLRSSKHIMLA